MNKVYLISVPLECFISQDFLSSFYRERWNTNAGNHDFFFGVGVAIAILYDMCA